MERQWQTADWTLAKRTDLRLLEQKLLTYFSQPLLTRPFMRWSMIFLAVNAAIFHEVTRTLLQLYVINFRLAAVSTHLVGRRF